MNVVEKVYGVVCHYQIHLSLWLFVLSSAIVLYGMYLFGYYRGWRAGRQGTVLDTVLHFRPESWPFG